MFFTVQVIQHVTPVQIVEGTVPKEQHFPSQPTDAVFWQCSCYSSGRAFGAQTNGCCGVTVDSTKGQSRYVVAQNVSEVPKMGGGGMYQIQATVVKYIRSYMNFTNISQNSDTKSK